MKKVALNSIYGIRNDKTCSFIYTINTSFDTLTMKLPKALEVPYMDTYCPIFKTHVIQRKL